MDFSIIIAIIGLVLWVVPGLLYIGYKLYRKSKVNEKNQALEAEWSKKLGEVATIRKATRELL